MAVTQVRDPDSDLFYCINTSNQAIEDYFGGRCWRCDNDDKPHIMPRKLVDEYVKRRVIKIVENINDYLVSHQDAQINYLIIRDGGIGDLILLAPCLKALKNHYPKIHLTVACDKPNIPVVRCMKYVDEVIPIGQYNTDAYNYWDDLRYYSETAHSRTRKHRTDVYHEKFQVPMKDKKPDWHFETWKLPFSIPEGSPLVVVQCGSSHKYRDWPHTEKFVRQMAQYAYVVLVDYSMHFPRIDGEKNICDMRQGTSLEDYLNIISQADLVVSPDSGGMHVALAQDIPVIGLFGIIRPDFRVRYYNQENCVFFSKPGACLKPYCGEEHMIKCAMQGDRDGACMMDISAAEVLKAARGILGKTKPQSRLSQRKAPKGAGHKRPKNEPAQANTIQTTKKAGGLTLVCICQNEAHNIPQWLTNVWGHPLISRGVVIDGGSTDKSVKLLKDAGLEVYTHPYLPHYHDQQAMQRNISFTYVRNGERCLVMDFDECFSGMLYDNLEWFLSCRHEFVKIPRRTFNTYADAMRGISQIKDYPDWQPRFFIWNHNYKWIRSPHHWIVNAPQPHTVPGWDILHFEAEGKDRNGLEKKWAEMENATRKYYG